MSDNYELSLVSTYLSNISSELSNMTELLISLQMNSDTQIVRQIIMSPAKQLKLRLTQTKLLPSPCSTVIFWYDISYQKIVIRLI